MESEIRDGTVLIENGTLLPKEIHLESEACVPGWSIIKDLDGSSLSRQIQKTGWTFVCLASEIRVTVFGIDIQKMVRRAIERILARTKSEKMNALEIKRVACGGSERFPLVRYLAVSARLRHIQENFFLGRPENVPALEMSALTSLNDSTGIRPRGVAGVQRVAS
jgi:hypothetical protein